MDEKHTKPLRIMLEKTFSKQNEDIDEKKEQLNSSLTSIESKLEKLEEKFLFEGVSQTIYNKHLTRLTKEKEVIIQELESPKIKLSNLKKYIDFSSKISSKLLDMWDKGEYDQKGIIQQLVFPSGIRYNRKKQLYRTQRVNSFLTLNPMFSERYKAKKESGEIILNDSPTWVGLRGVELF